MYHIWGGEGEMHSVLMGNIRERDCLEDIGVDERIILKWILTFSVMSFSMPGFCCGPSNIL